MGGLKKLTPFTYSMIIIGSLALIGIPFFIVFYSKDLILEVAYGKYSPLLRLNRLFICHDVIKVGNLITLRLFKVKQINESVLLGLKDSVDCI